MKAKRKAYNELPGMKEKVKQYNKEYYQRRKKEKNDKENLYQFTHTRKGEEHKITLYGLN